MSDPDERLMRRALELAERGRGLTSPNPMVGAVLAAPTGEVVGEGAHLRAGEAHAEVAALTAAGPRARGATLYLTLEPCVHHGRTPPCAPAIVAAGVRRVVAAIEDPNPLVAGRGLAALRRAGIEVVAGVLAEAATRQNRVFLTAMTARRPHVTLKAAMTLDGKIADAGGASRWITGEPARVHAHRLRSQADAVLVGVNTVLADDPALTVRLDPPWPREPYRVVLDTDARTPAEARVLRAGDPARAVVAVSQGADAGRVRALAATGAVVLRCPAREGRVDVGSLLEALFRREVCAVLVEGGGEVHASFLETALVDRVAIFVAPLLLGGRGAPGPVGGAGRELGSAVRLGALEITRLGADVLLEADVVRGPEVR